MARNRKKAIHQKAPVVGKTQGENGESMELDQGTPPNIPKPETIADLLEDPMEEFYNKGSLNPQDHVLKTDEATEKVRKKLIKTGRYSELTSALSIALVECGWKTDVENYCKMVLRRNPKLKQHELVEEIRMIARNLVPSSITQNLTKHIQTYYLEPELKKTNSKNNSLHSGESKQRKKFSHSGESSNAHKISPHSEKLSTVQKKSSHTGKSPRTQKKSFKAGESLSAI